MMIDYDGIHRGDGKEDNEKRKECEGQSEGKGMNKGNKERKNPEDSKSREIPGIEKSEVNGDGQTPHTPTAGTPPAGRGWGPEIGVAS